VEAAVIIAVTTDKFSEYCNYHLKFITGPITQQDA
jgi:hypothetical protein